MAFIAYIKSKGKLILSLMVVGTAMTWFTCGSCQRSVDLYIIVSFYIALIWILMWLGNEFIVCWLEERIPWTKEPVKRLIVGTIIVIGYSLFVAWGLGKFFETTFDFRIGGNTHLMLTVVITVTITVLLTSRSFLLNWRQSAIDAERLQKESMAAKYESLKNQVNPHFLFNSFNALSNLVYEDPDKAVRFIKQLSEVYRYVLDTRDREVVSLDEELRFLQSYLYLQKIRFADKLDIDLQLNGTSGGVAPLALQILVENAIKHNVVSEEDPLQVKIYADDGYIVVKNNLQKKASIGEAFCRSRTGKHLPSIRVPEQ